MLFFSILPVASHDDMIRTIQQRGQLVVAMAQEDQPPFFGTDKQGQAIGVDVELSQEIAHNLGVKLKLLRTAVTYDEVVNQVAEGKADLAISNLSITLQRAQKVNYSKQYITVKKSILLNQKTFSELKKTDNESLKSFFQAGNKLGVVKGSSYVEFSKIEFPQADLVEYDTWEGLVKDLDKGIIAAGFWDEFEVDKIIFFQPQGAFRYQAISLKVPTDKVAIVVPLSQQNFLNWINTLLDLKTERLTVKDLLNLYKKYENPYEK